jgi:hypothetical protein
MTRGTKVGRAIALLGLVAVVLLWWFAPGPNSPIEAGEAGEGRTNAAPSEGNAREPEARPTAEASVADSRRSPVAVESAPQPIARAPPVEDPGALTIRGFVRDSRGQSLRHSPSAVALIDESGERRVSTIANDRYTFDGLQPGTYSLGCRVPGYEYVERSISLAAGDPVHEEDFALDAVWSLLVRIVTPEGEDVRSLLEKESKSVFARPAVFVTIDPPAKRIPPDFEMDGSVLLRSDFSGERSDRVQLRLDPPLHVSIVFGESVLATQRVEDRVEELTFVLGMDRFRRSLAGLVVRVADCESGMPAANATVSLSTDEITEMGTKTDAQGIVRFADRLPGLYEMWARSKGCAIDRRSVDLVPGETTDLGTITLDKGVAIRGICVDADGTPSQAPACLRPAPDAASVVNALFSLKVDAEGRFALVNLAAGRYMTWVASAPRLGAQPQGQSGWETSPILVDTRAGPVEDLRIVVSRAVPVTLRPTTEAGALRFSVITTEGLKYREGTFYENAPQRIELAPGTYKLRLMRRREVVRELPFTVAKDPVILDVSP